MYRYLINYFLPIVHTQGVIFYCYLFFFLRKVYRTTCCSTVLPPAPALNVRRSFIRTAISKVGIPVVDIDVINCNNNQTQSVSTDALL